MGLLPIFEREGIAVHLEAHPDDFIERNGRAVDLVRGINSPFVRYVYCALHTFHLGGIRQGPTGICGSVGLERQGFWTYYPDGSGH